MVKRFSSFYQPMIERFTMGIILYPTLKNPAADILGLFKFIASVIWLICFKNSKLIIIIDYNSIRKDYLILNRVHRHFHMFQLVRNV